jgi:class 3 adenylate cyclase
VAESSSKTGLRLFLSADLAGSTAFKQSGKLDEWQKFFREFYRQLPALVQQKLVAMDFPEIELPVWKLIGDEIVFSTPLDHWQQPPRCLAAFRAAVAEYRQRTVAATGGRLDVKCAGWTAGFPVGNIQVEPHEHLPADFIGPGMDIGFRLVKAASPRRMLLSVELAWLLSLPNHSPSATMFVGRGLELKGVAKGRTYPCIWLDNFLNEEDRSPADKLELEEERLRGTAPKECVPTDLHTFCQGWIENMGPPFVIPFIDGDTVIGQRPPSYEELFVKVTTEESQGPSDDVEPLTETAPPEATDILTSLAATLQPPKP